MKKVALIVLLLLLGGVIRQQYLQPQRLPPEKVVTVSDPSFPATNSGPTENELQPTPALAELDIQQAAQLRIPNQIIATVEASGPANEPTPSTEAIYTVVPASTVKWTGRRVGGAYHGTLGISEGRINLQGGIVTQGVLVFDMSTIITTDTDAAALTEALKSEDFFDIATYPTTVFTITKVSGSKITGVLTIKGISNSIVFPGTIIVENGDIIVDAEFAFDRKLRNILGGGPVTSDFIELDFTVRFTKK